MLAMTRQAILRALSQQGHSPDKCQTLPSDLGVIHRSTTTTCWPGHRDTSPASSSANRTRSLHIHIQLADLPTQLVSYTTSTGRWRSLHSILIATKTKQNVQNFVLRRRDIYRTQHNQISYTAQSTIRHGTIKWPTVSGTISEIPHPLSPELQVIDEAY